MWLSSLDFDVEFKVQACEGWQWKEKYNMMEVSHDEVIRVILEQDKPVLVEVPLCLSRNATVKL